MVLPFSNESSSKLHNFSCFTPKMVMKRSKFTSAACAIKKLCVTKGALSTTPCDLVRSKRHGGGEDILHIRRVKMEEAFTGQDESDGD